MRILDKYTICAYLILLFCVGHLNGQGKRERKRERRRRLKDPSATDILNDAINLENAVLNFDRAVDAGNQLSPVDHIDSGIHSGDNIHPPEHGHTPDHHGQHQLEPNLPTIITDPAGIAPPVHHGTHVDLPGEHGNTNDFPIIHRTSPDSHAGGIIDPAHDGVHIDHAGVHGNHLNEPAFHIPDGMAIDDVRHSGILDTSKPANPVDVPVISALPANPVNVPIDPNISGAPIGPDILQDPSIFGNGPFGSSFGSPVDSGVVDHAHEGVHVDQPGIHGNTLNGPAFHIPEGMSVDEAQRFGFLDPLANDPSVIGGESLLSQEVPSLSGVLQPAQNTPVFPGSPNVPVDQTSGIPMEVPAGMSMEEARRSGLLDALAHDASLIPGGGPPASSQGGPVSTVTGQIQPAFPGSLNGPGIPFDVRPVGPPVESVVPGFDPNFPPGGPFASGPDIGLPQDSFDEPDWGRRRGRRRRWRKRNRDRRNRRRQRVKGAADPVDVFIDSDTGILPVGGSVGLPPLPPHQLDNKQDYKDPRNRDLFPGTRGFGLPGQGFPGSLGPRIPGPGFPGSLGLGIPGQPPHLGGPRRGGISIVPGHGKHHGSGSKGGLLGEVMRTALKIGNGGPSNRPRLPWQQRRKDDSVQITRTGPIHTDKDHHKTKAPSSGNSITIVTHTRRSPIQRIGHNLFSALGRLFG